jgi:hypothetical protein
LTLAQEAGKTAPPLLAMWVNDLVRVLTGAAFSACIGLATWLPASASPSRGLVARAATYVVSAAAQRSALAFWTPPRMAAASAAGRPTRAAISPDVQGGLIAPRGTPTAAKFTGVATVGALFYTTGSKKHFCTASVIDSALRDIVLTAAHCVYSIGYATNIAYVPEYHSGTRPLGIWAVRAISVAAGWQARASGHGRPRPRPEKPLRAGHRGHRLQRQRRPSGPVPDEEL